MAASLPYMLACGLIPKILTKIQEARRPDRFTQDFLETKLGFGGGSAMAMIPLLKRIGFLASDGTPTALYDKFRNTHTQGQAMAQAVKTGFKDIYEVNEYAHDLAKDKLSSIITQITGAEQNSRTTKAIVGTFNNLKEFAEFNIDDNTKDLIDADQYTSKTTVPPSIEGAPPLNGSPRGGIPNNVDLKLSYTINLNLPETSNPDVFNAIFKSLKENLLKE